MLKILLLIIFPIVNFCYSQSNTKRVEQLSHCGNYTIRNKTNKLIVAGKIYDSVVPLGNGYDSKVSLLCHFCIFVN